LIAEQYLDFQIRGAFHEHLLLFISATMECSHCSPNI
jgi:hypothetical protein